MRYLLLVTLLLSGCEAQLISPPMDDGGVVIGDTGPTSDTSDATVARDAPMVDAGTVSPDSGTDAYVAPPCTGIECPDAGVRDAGLRSDAGSDAGTRPDAGPPADRTAIVQLALGDTHTCLLRASGLVRCWGGDGVPILTNAVEIAAVGTQSYARLTDGSVVQWTRSSGPTSPAAEMPPEPVMPAPMYGSGESFPLPTGDYVEIYAGRRHTCGRRSGGSVWCWGQNVLSQLGRETGELTETGASYPPGETLLAGARMDALVLGVGRDHSCVALRDGRVMCWGSNSEGQLGRWVMGLETLEPVEPNSFFY